eukprot:1461847-Rhodomonas_salina.1
MRGPSDAQTRRRGKEDGRRRGGKRGVGCADPTHVIAPENEARVDVSAWHYHDSVPGSTTRVGRRRRAFDFAALTKTGLSFCTRAYSRGGRQCPITSTAMSVQGGHRQRNQMQAPAFPVESEMILRFLVSDSAVRRSFYTAKSNTRPHVPGTKCTAIADVSF